MERRPEPELMDLAEEARVYARANFNDVNQAFVARLLELAADTPTATVVDLGTGPAGIPVLIAKARPNWHITAVDASKPMLTIAQVGIKMSNLADRIKIHQADVKVTNLPDQSFDIVICNSLLHHMPDPSHLWTEIKRLTKPNGLIFVRDLRRPDSDDAAKKLVELHAATEPPLLQKEFHRSLLAAFTPDEIRRQLDAAGLSGLSVAPIPDRHVEIFGRISGN